MTDPIQTITKMESESDNDASSASVSSTSEEGPARILRRKHDGLPVQVERRRSSRKVARKSKKPSTKFTLPTNIDIVRHHLTTVSKSLRGETYTPGLSKRVMRAVLQMQYDWLDKKQKAGAKGRVTKPNVRGTISHLFGISTHTLTGIVQRFFKDSSMYAKPRTGGLRRQERVRCTERNIVMVRHFVREKRSKKKKVTAVQVTEHLLEEGVLEVPKDEYDVYMKKEMHAAVRAVRRFLVKNGYRRGSRKNGHLRMSLDNIAKRDTFLQTLVQNRALPKEERMREVYLDESYIHHHYQWKPSENLYDPADDYEYGTKDRHKGERYCFICAIQGPSPNPRGLYDDAGGVVPFSWWDFSPTRKSDHKGDYHKVFNGTNFIKWFKEQLLQNLNEPSIIIMDNAKYHCVYNVEVPKIYKLNVAELKSYLDSKGVQYSTTDTKTILKKKAKDWILQNEQWETVKAADEAGHQVLWTPPGFSDLQPIELAWARIKGNVGRQYDDKTKLTDVHERLLRQVELLDTDEGIAYINKVIEKCYQKSANMWNEINKDEEDENGASKEANQEENNKKDESGSDSSSSSSFSSSDSSSSVEIVGL